MIDLCAGHRVYADVPEHFAFINCRGVFDKLAHTDVLIGGELAYLAGRYIVYKTFMGGGGTGMGPHDVFPDGHHVFCERADNPLIRVDFYQTGCFTAMIRDITPVGRAERRWVLPDGLALAAEVIVNAG